MQRKWPRLGPGWGLFALLIVGVFGALVFALRARPPEAETGSQAPGKGSPEAMIHEYFKRLTGKVESRSLEPIPSREEWERRRPLLRRQLMEMLGLWPEPVRGDLRARVTGKIEHEEFTVEKLHFQSIPGLYVTANFYLPKGVKGPLPTILYVCGHKKVEIDGVSYGNKVAYQHHPIWFARHGYASLVIDTLQLGEVPGLHHGTSRFGMWWWVSKGYTSAGLEAWNGIRALDYLETRPEVDMKRVGVTGRSGGGIYTWWVAALDDRPAVLVPVAGMTDLRNHVVDGVVEGHCDCMYMLNGYQWDFPLVAALAAPRPLLLSNSDKDTIFPLNGVVRLHEKLKEVYRLYGQEEKLGLFISEGPHADTQVLQVAAFEWMERHLKGKKNSPIERVGEKLFTPQQLKVLAEAPADARNGEIHKQFIPDTEPPPVPLNLGGWEQMRLDWMGKLRQKVFRNWPKATEPLNLARVAGKSAQGLRLERYEFTSEENIRLPLWVVTAPVSGTGTNNTKAAPKRVELRVLDEASWKEWVGEIGPLFAAELGVSQDKAERPQSVVRLKGRLSRRLARENSALAVFAPRGVGPTRWKVEESQHIRRRFHLLGLTWESSQVWDVRRAVRTLGGDFLHPRSAGHPARERICRRRSSLRLLVRAFRQAAESRKIARFPPPGPDADERS